MNKLLGKNGKKNLDLENLDLENIDTEALIKKQQDLLKAMDNMGPLMEKAQTMLGGIQSSAIGKMLGI